MTEENYPPEFVEAVIGNNIGLTAYHQLKDLQELLVHLYMALNSGAIERSIMEETFQVAFSQMAYVKDYMSLMNKANVDRINSYKAEHNIQNVSIESPERTVLKNLVLDDERIKEVLKYTEETLEEQHARITAHNDKRMDHEIMKLLKEALGGNES